MSRPTITVYEKPTCTTCRRLHDLLVEAGVDFEKVNYFVEPLSKAQARPLFKGTGSLNPGPAMPFEGWKPRPREDH